MRKKTLSDREGACHSGASRYCWPTPRLRHSETEPRHGALRVGKAHSKEIRKRIGHPVIDADGHWPQVGPSLNDYLKEVAGPEVVNSFRRRGGYFQKSLTMTPEERAQTRRAQEAFWGVPAKNTLDRATAMLPRLFYDRLGEFGFDFTVLYPTAGLSLDTSRKLSFGGRFVEHSTCISRINSGNSAIASTPAAAIPMHTPEEAISGLEYIVKELGLKVAVMTSMVPRQVPAAQTLSTEIRRLATSPERLGFEQPLQL